MQHTVSNHPNIKPPQGTQFSRTKAPMMMIDGREKFAKLTRILHQNIGMGRAQVGRCDGRNTPTSQSWGHPLNTDHGEG